MAFFLPLLWFVGGAGVGAAAAGAVIGIASLIKNKDTELDRVKMNLAEQVIRKEELQRQADANPQKIRENNATIRKLQEEQAVVERELAELRKRQAAGER